MNPHRLTITVIIFLIPIIGFSSIIHIPGDYPTIQGGIDSAGDGDTILIADGTYSGPGNIGIEWGASTKHLLIMSENGHDNCIIDCMQEGRGFLLNNGQDHRDVIDGLTITNGLAIGAGGAIHISSASPIIRNCMLITNSASGYSDNSYSGGGGAIMVFGTSDPLIQGNIIRDNIASNLGGGLLFAEYATGVVESNIIDGNKALDDWGGGIALWNNAELLIINNLIINNSCSGFNGGRGGGIYLDHTESLLVNNTIAFNFTTGDEYGDGFGGGICIGNWADPVLQNCIIWHNRSGDTSMNIYFDPQEWLDISYCNVENDLGHIFDLEPHTNMDAQPEFVDTANGNYQLLWKSPCINKGNPDTTGLHLPDFDLAGSQRIFESTVDIGAYEFNMPSAMPMIIEDEEIHLYPNPSSGIFFVDIRTKKIQDMLVVRIHNVEGKLVMEEHVDTSVSTIPIDFSLQPDGIYLLTVLAKGQLMHKQKIIKD